MNDLPSGWTWATLRDVAEPVEKVDLTKLGRDRFRYVDISSVDSASLSIMDPKELSVSEAPSRARQLLKAGDTVFSTVRPNLRRIAFVHAGFDEEIASTGFCVLRPSIAFEPRFLFHLVTAGSFIDRIVAKQRGVSYPAVRPLDILEERIPIPPRAEQRRIVEALEDHLSRLESGVHTLQTVQARIEKLGHSLVNDLVLGRQFAKGLGARSELKGALNRFDYRSLPYLPIGWHWSLASDVCETIDSGSTPSSELMTQGEGDVPFLKVYNMNQSGLIDFTKNPTFVRSETHSRKLRRSLTLPGDVLTNIVGPPLGKSAIVPSIYSEWNINQAIVRFRPSAQISSQWLAACMKSPFVISLLKGTARATAGQFNVALSTCRELPLPIPPRETQDSLIDYFERQQEIFGQLDVSLTKNLQKEKSLHSRILNSAFSGQLVDQDSNDEPASVLLDRIKTARAAEKPAPRRRTSRKALSV